MDFKYYNIKEIQNFINKNNISIQKKFGQNFLIDEKIADLIVNKLNIIKTDLVIEIGCGLGSLTNKILKTGCSLIGFELDRAYIKHLKKIFDNKNFTLIEGDFLKKYKDVFNSINKSHYSNILITGNLPYYITKPIFEKVFTSEIDFNKIIFMIQKEVGWKILSKENDEKYSYLSIISRVNKEIEILTELSSDCFYPSPNVDSIIMLFKKCENPEKIIDKKLFFKISQSLFINRRKKLKNNLLLSPFLNSIEKQLIVDALKNTNISGDVRGESLSIIDCIKLSNEISILQKN